MADALDPRTRWVYDYSRSRTDTIHLLPLVSGQIDRILQLTTPEGALIYTESQPDDQDRANPLLKYFESNDNAMPVRSTLKSFRRRGRILGLLERPYYDLEFWDAHAGFYDKCFREHARFCERFHFFSLSAIANPSVRLAEGVEEQLLANLLDAFTKGKSWTEIEQAFRNSGGIGYLGYLVLRPTPSFSVGRAAILFDGRSETEIAESLGLSAEEARRKSAASLEEFGRIPFLKASLPCRANLLATRLELPTIDFMQQDPNLGACATVSLWVTARVTAERFALNRFNYATITRQAIAGLAHHPDSGLFDPTNLDEGLNDIKIGVGIRNTGARPLYFNMQEGQSVELESMRLRQRNVLLHRVRSSRNPLYGRRPKTTPTV